MTRNTPDQNPVISSERFQDRIFLIRGHRVMLSPHLAELYGVENKALLQAVKRNIDRFPEDFMFQLTNHEFSALRSQIVTLKTADITSKRGQHLKYLPYAFTEQGVAMLSSVLRSPPAVKVNIEIMRTKATNGLLDLHRGMNSVAINIYWSNNDNAFIAEVLELPGCTAHGDTYEQALKNAQDAIQLWLDTAKEGVNLSDS